MERKLRIGCVSYLNARPLIEQLDPARVDLLLDVPAQLLDGLRSGRFDVALLPVIDFQRQDGLRIIPAGAIGCDGPAMTVRIFSRVPIPQVQTLACDTESHTSVALARIVLSRRHGVRPELIPLRHDARAEARLLIGDKVVCDPPTGFEHQLDLGGEWKAMTGKPFVFATWMARPDVDCNRAFELLDHARRTGLAHLDQIALRHGPAMRWPADLAQQYLANYLRYELGAPELDAIHIFFLMAKEEGIVDEVKPLDVWRI